MNFKLSTEGRNRAELYRKAAKLMEDGDRNARGSCCWAIGLTKNPRIISFDGSMDDDCLAMKRIFRPRGGIFWMGATNYYDEEAHDRRILALCFMAAMVEAGDA